MPRIRSVFACAIALAALAACSGDSSKSAEPAAPAAAPDAKRVDSATASTVKGKVLLEGTPPENPVLKMASDPACGTAEVRAESYLAENGALQNVFVHIKNNDGLGKYIFDTPTEPVKLDQKGCRYVPHVLGIRVSQPLEVSNSDQTLHNVHGMPQTNREFNHGQPIAGMKNTVAFSSPEVMVPFKCDVHAWMSAYVGVVSHPYFAVTGKEGTFELQTIPPGTYTIEAWHEKLGRQTQTVTLGEKDSKDLTFTFKAGT